MFSHTTNNIHSDAELGRGERFKKHDTAVELTVRRASGHLQECLCLLHGLLCGRNPEGEGCCFS